MNKLNLAMAVMASFSLIACSGAKVSPENAERVEGQNDYVIVQASHNEYPEWIKEPTEGDEESEVKKNRYFVNESMHLNKRLCKRSAAARSTAYIAQEIAQFMKNSYAEATQGSEDEEVSEYMQEQLASETQSFIVGARVIRTYWEKRKYQEKLGAAEDMMKYSCHALVKMKRSSLAKAIKKSRAKLLNGIDDPEVKKKTNKALAQVEDKFTNL